MKYPLPLHRVRTVRRWMGLRSEYRARRAIYRRLPVTHRTRYESIYHCTSWKTASQWTRLCLSDPRFYSRVGLLPDLFENKPPPHLNPVLESMSLAEKRNCLVSPIFADANLFDLLSPGNNYRVVAVVRDPRDLLVSYYFSNALSHPELPEIAESRATLEALTIEDGLRVTANAMSPLLSIGESWLAREVDDERVLVVKYEDLTDEGGRQLATWRQIIEHVDARFTDQALTSLLRTYSFKNMSGRERGAERNSHKYRSGVPGSAGRYWSAELEEMLGAHLGPYTKQYFGYV